MSNILDFLNNLWHWAKGLFDAAEKTWHKLEPEIQDALIKGSGIIATINENLGKTPTEVFSILQKVFPDLTEDKLHSLLLKVQGYFNIATNTEDESLLTTIENLQEFLSNLGGKEWQAISSAISQFIAIVLAPADTPFAKVSMLTEYVYNNYVKGGVRPGHPH